MKPKIIKIDNFKHFHRCIPEIVSEINQNTRLGILAMANPLLTLKEMGYEIPADVEKKIERWLRFETSEIGKLEKLEKEIEKLSNEKLNLDNPDEVEKLLFKKLKLKRPKNLPPIDLNKKVPSKSNPLQKLKGTNKIIDLLREYQSVASGKTAFVPLQKFNQLKSGKKKAPVSKITFNLPENYQHHE
jgi:DNA polymerase I-like protein with 3'-5' exonuclease and polymerase domains